MKNQLSFKNRVFACLCVDVCDRISSLHIFTLDFLYFKTLYAVYGGIAAVVFCIVSNMFSSVKSISLHNVCRVFHTCFFEIASSWAALVLRATHRLSVRPSLASVLVPGIRHTIDNGKSQVWSFWGGLPVGSTPTLFGYRSDLHDIPGTVWGIRLIQTTSRLTGFSKNRENQMFQTCDHSRLFVFCFPR